MEQQKTTELPRMMTIREVARTGLLPEHALRQFVKQGRVPYIQAGNRALVNYNALVKMLNEL